VNTVFKKTSKQPLMERTLFNASLSTWPLPGDHWAGVRSPF